jgi:hypothetical protein
MGAMPRSHGTGACQGVLIKICCPGNDVKWLQSLSPRKVMGSNPSQNWEV